MKSLKKFENYLISYDRWGKAITVNYKGSGVYKTRLGALLSISSYILLIIFTVNLFTAFIDGSKQTETTQTLKYDTFGGEPRKLSDMGFGVQIILPAIPARIATFTVLRNSNYEFTEIPLEKCVETELKKAEDYWVPRIGED